MLHFTFLFFFVCSLFEGTNQECYAKTGPAGSPECVLLQPYYSKYQWATCLTDTYIKLRSNGNHLCRDQTTVYCYYQCMLEVHGVDSGPVLDDCACGRDASKNVTTPLPRSTTPIPDWCFSPNGTECNWYRDCLERRFPCNQELNSYALEYAEKFCNLYTNNFYHFDIKGQNWIDAVRKCLQLELVPILRPFVHKSCEEIKEMSFDSHPDCYVNPGPSQPSICDIGVRNMWRIFWTVKGSLVQDSGSTLTQLWNVSRQCHWDENVKQLGMTILKFVIPVPITAMKLMLLTNDLQKYMSGARKWDEKGIAYFAYPKPNNTGRNKRSLDENSTTRGAAINILLAPKSEFDLNAPDAISVNISMEADSIIKAIEEKELILRPMQGARFTNMSICGDDDCIEKIQTIPVPYVTGSNEKIQVSKIFIVVCAILGGLLL